MNLYKEKFHDTTDPAAVISRERRGPGELQGAALIPGSSCWTFMSSRLRVSLQLDSSGVMIMKNARTPLAESFYFRARGIVDSS